MASSFSVCLFVCLGSNVLVIERLYHLSLSESLLSHRKITAPGSILGDMCYMQYRVLLGHVISTADLDVPFQYATACNVTDETGTVVKERECMGKCGSRGHHISYGGKNLTAYFCRPRRSTEDHIESTLESIEAYIEEFMSDLEELFESEFGDDWWYSGDDDHVGGVGKSRWSFEDDEDDDDDDWWPFGGDNGNDNEWWPFGGNGGDDNEGWPFGGNGGSDSGWWPFGGDSSGNSGWWPFGGNGGSDNGWWPFGGSSGSDSSWWPFGGDDGNDNGWWPFGGSGGNPSSGGRPTERPGSGYFTPPRPGSGQFTPARPGSGHFTPARPGSGYFTTPKPYRPSTIKPDFGSEGDSELPFSGELGP